VKFAVTVIGDRKMGIALTRRESCEFCRHQWYPFLSFFLSSFLPSFFIYRLLFCFFPRIFSNFSYPFLFRFVSTHIVSFICVFYIFPFAFLFLSYFFFNYIFSSVHSVFPLLLFFLVTASNPELFCLNSVVLF
jgi:hypothetical protein